MGATRSNICSSCIHFTTCMFRIKMHVILSHHSSFFNKGSYSVAGEIARVCKHYANRYLPQILESPEELSFHEWEKKCIIKALDKSKGNRKKASGLLEIGERTLYRKIRKYGLPSIYTRYADET